MRHHLHSFPWVILAASLAGWAMLPCLGVQQLAGQDQLAGEESTRYSAEVVAKAAQILEQAGLQRSGKTIRPTNTTEVSRAITGTSRQRRELRLVAEQWQQAKQRAAVIRQELRRLDRQQGELNLQLARVAGVDTTANNRLVGTIEAIRSKMRTLADQTQLAKEDAAEKRVALNAAESEYAESIMAIRRDFNVVNEALEKSLTDGNVQIALRVMHQNHDTPKDLTAGQLLSVLDKRIEKIEQEIFSETIPLEVKSGSAYVNVVIGNKTMRMVVDSGATLISLPSKTAAELGIKIPLDARELRLVMADGRSIPGRLVTLARVRVGQFEAEDVDAAVLDPVADGAEALLGMSYLGNFKFEIDTAEKSLKMLRVAAD
jgi:aspartyl protease family protein